MRIGIDLGGTKIEAIALDDDGTIRARSRVPSTPDDYAGTLVAIHDLVRDIETSIGDEAPVGIGMPGTLSPVTGLVRNANSTWLNGKPFGDDIERTLGRPVRVANDADCFTLSEAVDGAAAGARVVFGVILGTGVGGGLAIDGAIWSGRNRIAGEWGHNGLPRVAVEALPLPRCWCGRDGCIETYLSGPALVADHRRHGHDAGDVQAIVAAAEAGDLHARGTLDRHARRLARALASVVNIVDPDIVVLGGGVSNIDALFETLPRLLPESVFADQATTPVVKNLHGDSSGVRGAAWLWPGTP